MTAPIAPPRPRRILAVASIGGHWEQMMLLRPAFEGCEVHFATSNDGLGAREGLNTYLLPDTNRHHPWLTLLCAWRAFHVVRRVRPDVVISTGAAPGLMCIVMGRLFGARTLWIDSIANAGRISGSGRMARRIATRTLTQWEHLSAEPGIGFAGRVL